MILLQIQHNTGLTAGLVGSFVNCYFNGLVTTNINGITALTAYFYNCAFNNQGIVSNRDSSFVNCSISANNKNTVSSANVNWGSSTYQSWYYLITPGAQTSSFVSNIFVSNCYSRISDNILGAYSCVSSSGSTSYLQFLSVNGCFLYNNYNNAKSAAIGSFLSQGCAALIPTVFRNNSIFGFNYGIMDTGAISNCSFAGCGVAINWGYNSGTMSVTNCAMQANNYDLGATSGGTINAISCIYAGATLGLTSINR